MTNDHYQVFKQQANSSDLLYYMGAPSWHVCMNNTLIWFSFKHFPDLQVFVLTIQEESCIQLTHRPLSLVKEQERNTKLHTLIRLNQSVSKSNPPQIHNNQHKHIHLSIIFVILLCVPLAPVRTAFDHYKNVFLYSRIFVCVYFCLYVLSKCMYKNTTNSSSIDKNIRKNFTLIWTTKRYRAVFNSIFWKRKLF